MRDCSVHRGNSKRGHWRGTCGWSGVALVLTGLALLACGVASAAPEVGNDSPELEHGFLSPVTRTGGTNFSPAKTGGPWYVPRPHAKRYAGSVKPLELPTALAFAKLTAKLGTDAGRRNFGQVFVTIDPEARGLRIEYCASFFRETDERVPASNRCYGEDMANTHLYLVLPDGVSISGMYQSVKAWSHETNQDAWLLAVPFEQTRWARRVEQFNKVMAFANGGYKERRGLEGALDNAIGLIPGKAGELAGKLKKWAKWVILRDEERRLETLKARYGNCYTVIKLPVFQENGNDLLKHTNLARRHTISLDYSGLASEAVAFVELPKIRFRKQGRGGTEARFGVNDLRYSFPVYPRVNSTDEVPTAGDHPFDAMPGKGVWTADLHRVKGTWKDFTTANIRGSDLRAPRWAPYPTDHEAVWKAGISPGAFAFMKISKGGNRKVAMKVRYTRLPEDRWPPTDWTDLLGLGGAVSLPHDGVRIFWPPDPRRALSFDRSYMTFVPIGDSLLLECVEYGHIYYREGLKIDVFADASSLMGEWKVVDPEPGDGFTDVRITRKGMVFSDGNGADRFYYHFAMNGKEAYSIGNARKLGNTWLFKCGRVRNGVRENVTRFQTGRYGTQVGLTPRADGSVTFVGECLKRRWPSARLVRK